MKIEDSLRIIKLIDTYGSLLTQKKYEMITSYYFDNLSLSEIGDNYSVSRQAVSDSINQSIKTLEEYEKKLKVISRDMKILDTINSIIDDCDDVNMVNRLKKILDDIRG